MKKHYVAILMLAMLAACNNPEKIDQAEGSIQITIDTSNLQTDEYGMKRYVMAYLKRGPSRDQDSAKAAQLQRAHLDNIKRMADKGSLVLAGPFLDNGEIRGIYIFNVESVEEAEKLTASDPAIQAGRLVMELHPWYGPASLQYVNELHKQIASKDI